MKTTETQLLSLLHWVSLPYPVCSQDVLVDEAQPDGEHGAPGRHDPVDDPELLLEVVPEDGEGGSVDQGGPGAKHDAVGQVEDLDPLVEPGGQTHAYRGQDGAQDGGQPQTDLVTEYPHQEGKEERCAYGQAPDQGWKKNMRRRSTFLFLPHLDAASSTPASSMSFLSCTKRIPKVLMIPKIIPLTRKQPMRTSHAQHPPSGGSCSLYFSLAVSLLFSLMAARLSAMRGVSGLVSILVLSEM